ncbi:MAG: hypothetical protein Q8N95_07160 [Desulfobacterales bacterium]|nr:hypothetical protein [Desulfobacterales bacterium]
MIYGRKSRSDHNFGELGLGSINQQNNGIKDNLKPENHANDSFQKENLLIRIKKSEINKGNN